MIWRIALAAWLTLLLAVVGQQSHAQFNGCSAGFCSRVAGGSVTPVTVDQCGPAATSNSGPAQTSFDANGFINLSAGLTNGALTILVIQGDGALSITGVSAVWDSAGAAQTMFPVGNAGSLTTNVFGFGLRAPVSGAKNLHVAWTNSAAVAVFMCSWSGVNQGSNAAAFKNFNSATNAAPVAITITASSGDKTFAGYGSLANFASASGTLVGIGIDNTMNTWATAASYASGPNPTLSGSPGSATTSVAAGFDIAP